MKGETLSALLYLNSRQYSGDAFPIHYILVILTELIKCEAMLIQLYELGWEYEGVHRTESDKSVF